MHRNPLELEVEPHLPDLHCPNCKTGLDVRELSEDPGWTEGEGTCPKCSIELVVDRSVTTHYYPMVKK